MSVNYREQYRPDQLEPFFPNEIIKMTVAVLCTLAVIMFFAILPVLQESVGIEGMAHHEEPANPQGATPPGIKPEWYFLAVYQYLRLMPTNLLGISGKTLGVLSQGVFVAIIVLLPFWYRKRPHPRPGAGGRLGGWAGRIAGRGGAGVV
jgi:quinol-cytochrome oxidoreductase complex cytochrome b subunit